MFVYQNKDGHICVTFTDNKPVDAPEYVIAVDEAEKKLFMVSGTIDEMPETETTVDEEAPVVKVPSVAELDAYTENDYTVEDVTLSEADNTKRPSVDELDAIEDEVRSDDASMTEADDRGIPSIDELDTFVENDDGINGIEMETADKDSSSAEALPEEELDA